MDIDAIIARLSRDDVWAILFDLVDYESPVRSTIRSALARHDTTEAELREVLRQAAEHFGPAALQPRQHQSAMPPDSDEPAEPAAAEPMEQPAARSDRSFGVDEGLVIPSPEGRPGGGGVSHSVRGGESEEAPPPQSADVPRYLNARSTESSVNAGDEFALMVWVGPDQVLTGGSYGSAQVTVGAVTLSIDLFAEDFELIDKRAQKLDVPSVGDSNRIRFALRAKRQGAGRIEIAAWNGSAQVGTVTLFVPVGAATVGTSVAKGEMEMREPEGGEYTLEIRFDFDERTYDFQLRSDDGTIWPPFTSAPLQASRIEVATNLATALNFEARNLGRLAPDEQLRKLSGLGTMLFQQMIPDDLKTVLWENRASIKRLNILSPGDPMPWELMRVTDARRANGQFLGESALVMRWRYGKRAPKKVANGPVLTVAGSDPPAALAEADGVMSRLGGGSRLDAISGLCEKLDQGGFGVLHFAAHNVNVTADALRSYVPIAGRPFNLNDLQIIPDDHYQASAPVIFMNACTSAGTAMLMTEFAGWAQEFLRCGAGAYVGSLWEVRDTTSRDFAAAFYASFSQGGTLGASMRAAREALPETDPTRYAYSLYGNPQAVRA